MQTLIRKYKKNRRKAKHIRFLHQKITELNKEVISSVLNNTSANNKAKLIRKYSRRLKLIMY